jgi:hypothetical protein
MMLPLDLQLPLPANSVPFKRAQGATDSAARFSIQGIHTELTNPRFDEPRNGA